MKQTHLLSLSDFTPAEVQEIIDLGDRIKASPQAYRAVCAGKTLAMIFQKPSTRTRISFQVGIYELGGVGLFLGAKDLQLGRGETIADTARVLSRYVSGIMARVFSHQDLIDLAQFSSAPVINGLSDLLHPCQALADLMTIREKKGTLKGLKLTYIGDGNNMAHSLLNGGAKTGLNVTIACPHGYEPRDEIVTAARQAARETGAQLEVTNDLMEAVARADIIYTDVWASMGQEQEAEKKRHDFAGWQVRDELFDRANPGSVFMHCLPAHRGEEVESTVCDAPYSIIFDQAENRLHVQKAVMALLMGKAV